MEKINCSHTELRSILELKVNPHNPNSHSLEQIDRLAEMIEHQGQRSPIVVSSRSGMVVKGHGRLEAIKSLGWKFCAIDIQNYDSDEDEYLDLVGDNAIAQWSNLDLSLINLKIQDFEPTTNLQLLGFKDFKVDRAEKPEKKEEALTLAICPECGHKF